jgi:diguanylate cyclase (GGDEF)-like protein/PAS domain S-box-containing protein
MTDQDKSKERLIQEIADLREQLDSQRQEAESTIQDTVQQMEAAIEHANRMSMEAEVMAAEMNTVFNASSTGLCVLDVNKKVIRINDAYARMSGVKKQEAEGRLCHELVGINLCHSENCLLDQVKKTGRRVEQEVEIELPDGKSRVYIVTGNPLHGIDGELAGIVESYNDITERKHMELELQRLATIDALTGAYNRRFFMEMAEKDLARVRRYGFSLSLVMFDLDHFKNINDTHGHGAGDQVLSRTGNLALEHLRQSDYLGRLGGEEFAVLLVDCNLEQAGNVAQRLRQAIEAVEVVQEGKTIRFTASFGAAEIQKAEDLAGLLARADEALYQAKNSGRNRVGLSMSAEPEAGLLTKAVDK